MKKIIFITTQPLNQRNLKRFHLLSFLQDNWVVEYWNVQNIFFKKSFFINSFKKYNFVKINYISFNNFFFLVKKIISVKNSYYIDWLDNSFLSYILRKIFYRKNNKRILVDSANYPSYNIKYLNFKILFNQLGFFFFIKSIKFILLIILRKFLDNNFNTKPYIHLVAGKMSRLRSENFYGKDIQIRSHAFDYNIYLRNTSNKKYLDKIVFIDQDWPSPFELNIRKGREFVTFEGYWKSLNIFFDYLENKFKKEVVVARHPRAKKNTKISDRKIITNFTDQLIKYSYINISHSSNAIQFVLLYKKPLIIISTNELEQNQGTVAYTEMFSLAKALDKKILNIDRFSSADLLKAMKVNNKIYNRYINNYIKEINSIKINSFTFLKNFLNKDSNY
jgi:hypothetical protein